jgi:hypothetical protein
MHVEDYFCREPLMPFQGLRLTKEPRQPSPVPLMPFWMSCMRWSSAHFGRWEESASGLGLLGYVARGVRGGLPK